MTTIYNDYPAPRPFNAGHTLTTMRLTAIGAGTLMVVLGTTGLALALITGGRLGDARAAYAAALASVILAGHMVIAVGALRGHRSLLQHQLALKESLAEGERELLKQLTETRAHLNTRIDTLQATVDTHASAITGGMDTRLDALEDQTDRVEHLLTRMFEAQEQQARIMGEALEDELRQRRNRNHGGG